MTTPAVRDNQSPLEAVLIDVHAALTDLLIAADEQYAAVAAGDHQRLESVTRQQERLSARLARAEAQRHALLNDDDLASAASTSARGRELYGSIGSAVSELKARQARTAKLLRRSIQLTNETLEFLVRLVTTPPPAYSSRGVAVSQQSLLVDGRA